MALGSPCGRRPHALVASGWWVAPTAQVTGGPRQLSAEAAHTGHELASLLDTVNGLQDVAAELRTALANPG